MTVSVPPTRAGKKIATPIVLLVIVILPKRCPGLYLVRHLSPPKFHGEVQRSKISAELLFLMCFMISNREEGGAECDSAPNGMRSIPVRMR